MNVSAVSPQSGSQFSAIAYLRWRMFVNSLRNRRGKMELVSRVVVIVAFTIGGLGGFSAAVGFAWYFVSHEQTELLALLLWPVFFFWQFFPVMATAFTNNPDSSDLLRYPLSYRSYFLIRMAYGSFDPACAIGGMALLGMCFGIGFASPALLPWAFTVLLVFAVFNLVFMQMVFAWLERWLAQRRTREIFSVLFVLLMFSFQLIGPAMNHVGHKSRPEVLRLIAIMKPVQSNLPPGLAAEAIGQASHGKVFAGSSSFILLCGITVAMGCLLHLRLNAQYRGENLSEVAARSTVAKTQGLRLGWKLPGFSQTVSAVFEKEVRYLGRSGPMLLTLVTPVFMLVIFRFGPMNPARQTGSFLARTPNMAFPAAGAYALLVLTNLIYNNFGGDAGGIQFFLAAPVRFSEIVLAKNLTHAAILILNAALAWVAVTLLYGQPAFDVTVATLAGLLFAAPLNFTVGNLLSIYSPKKLDFSTFGRQRASQFTVLISLGVQIVVVGVGAAVFLTARYFANIWIAALLFLILSAITIPVYAVTLGRVDRILRERRETLVAELCRA
jgi:ABC-2 type transport system permease protein